MWWTVRTEALELLKREDKPTCIIYSDDYSAVGGIAAIESMGLKIPEDISVAGYDDIFIASQLQPRLTTVRQDTERIGMKAAEQLIKLMTLGLNEKEAEEQIVNGFLK